MRPTCEYWDEESRFCALHRPSAQPEPYEELDFVQEHKKIPVVLNIQQKGKNMPSAQPEPCDVCEDLEEGDTLYSYSSWDGGIRDYIRDIKFCPKCGRRLKNGH